MSENINLESKERLFKEFSHFSVGEKIPLRFLRTDNEASMLGVFLLHTMLNVI